MGNIPRKSQNNPKKQEKEITSKNPKIHRHGFRSQAHISISWKRKRNKNFLKSKNNHQNTKNNLSQHNDHLNHVIITKITTNMHKIPLKTQNN